MKIFDFKQADWLIKQGCRVIGAGKGQRDGQKYILFDSDDHFKSMFKKYKENLCNNN